MYFGSAVFAHKSFCLLYFCTFVYYLLNQARSSNKPLSGLFPLRGSLLITSWLDWSEWRVLQSRMQWRTLNECKARDDIKINKTRSEAPTSSLDWSERRRQQTSGSFSSCGRRWGILTRHRRTYGTRRLERVRVSGGHLCRRQKHRPSRQARLGGHRRLL